MLGMGSESFDISMRNFRVVIVVGFILLSSLLSNCGTYPTQAHLQRIYRGQLETAAAQMTEALLKKVSPMSGRNPNHFVYLDQIHYDERENIVSAAVMLTWQARDFWSGVSYGECQVLGRIHVYMPIRQLDRTRAKLDVARWNEHFILVSKESQRTEISHGIIIDLK